MVSEEYRVEPSRCPPGIGEEDENGNCFDVIKQRNAFAQLYIARLDGVRVRLKLVSSVHDIDVRQPR